MSASNNNNQTNNVPVNVELHGAGGKTKIVSLEQLRKPHAVTASPEFIKNHPIRDTQQSTGSNTSGGLLQTGNHRPSSSHGNK